MLYQEFPHLNISLSKIGFGGASLSSSGGGYGFGDISAKDAQGLVEAALDFGVNIFDTAPIYGFGQSEETLGQVLNQVREKVYIVSKAGVGWHENKRVNMSNDPKIVQKMLEDSLRRLNTEYIDFYMTHWPDPRVDIRYSLEVLAKAKDQGKIKYLGLGNTSQEDYELAKEVISADVLQSECNCFNNAFEELNYGSETVTMGWGSFDKGILTGKLKADRIFEKSDCRSWAPWWKKSLWKDKVKLVQAYKVSDENEYISLALAYSLSKVGVSLFGSKNIKQLESLITLLDQLPTEEKVDEYISYLRDGLKK